MALYVLIALVGPVFFLGLGIFLAKKAGRLMNPVFYALIVLSLVGGTYAAMELRDRNFAKEFGPLIAQDLSAVSFESIAGKKQEAGELRRRLLLANPDGSRFNVPIYTSLELPDDAAEGNPESIGTILFIQKQTEESGRYSNGIRAYRLIYHVCAVDASTHQVVARKNIVGEPPSEVRRSVLGFVIPPGNTGENAANEQLSEWIRASLK
jgi:hypothetical protein